MEKNMLEINDMLNQIKELMNKISSIIEKELMKKHCNDAEKMITLLRIANYIDSCHVCSEDYKGIIHRYYLPNSDNEKVRLMNNIICLASELNWEPQLELILENNKNKERVVKI